MMDYAAGQSRPQGSAVSNEPGAVSSVSQSRPRTQGTVGVSTNISTGGPHILLFERDQQFAALLGSELQLAGYECHTARTAVEVFDAIARYSIRLVLVNLAQAAAARREFWVALDTQRRGRGVQVLTFHCSNLAGYGPVSDDPDDRSHSMLADLEVDGMLGIMNMVNAIRSRLALSANGSSIRPASSPGLDARQQAGGVTSDGSKISQTTMPLPAASAGNSNSSSARISATPSVQSPTRSISPTNPANPVPEATSPSRQPTVNHTDKIRAVIYPNQRSWSAQRDAEGLATTSNGSSQNSEFANPTFPISSSTTESQTRNEGPAWQPQNQPEQKESGLAQLSRMVQERRTPVMTSPTPPSTAHDGAEAISLNEVTMPQQRIQASVGPAISEQSLRASPIEDLPNDRIVGNTRPVAADSGITATRLESSSQDRLYQNNQSYQQPSTLASIAMQVSSFSSVALPATEQGVAAPPSHQRNPDSLPVEGTGHALIEQLQPANPESLARQTDDEGSPSSQSTDRGEQNLIPVAAQQSAGATAVKPIADNALLLDIVQSLPLMSSPPPQQALSGRATRSLGSVLLEGHLVPQDRLEVALSIQRMLRGVDMNYQLGEILLMFKLLTPDQLLAASLVSYGLITTTQISALGRIRQELHSIGLEYDLENLLILFRILTSEQLREVRSTWSS